MLWLELQIFALLSAIFAVTHANLKTTKNGTTPAGPPYFGPTFNGYPQFPFPNSQLQLFPKTSHPNPQMMQMAMAGMMPPPYLNPANLGAGTLPNFPSFPVPPPMQPQPYPPFLTQPLSAIPTNPVPAPYPLQLPNAAMLSLAGLPGNYLPSLPLFPRLPLPMPPIPVLPASAPPLLPSYPQPITSTVPIPKPVDSYYCSAHASFALSSAFGATQRPLTLRVPGMMTMPPVAASRDDDPEVGIGRPPIGPANPLLESRQYCRYLATASTGSCKACCQAAAHYSPLSKKDVLGILLLFDPIRPPIHAINVGISAKKKRQANNPPPTATPTTIDRRRYQCLCCAPKHLIAYHY